MECFTDAQGRFVFPGRLFPDLPDSAGVPPSVAGRRDAIEREFGVLKAAGIERNYKWAVNVFQFQDTWGDLLQVERGEEMLAQARRIVDKLASGSTQYAGPANYMLGLLASRDSESRVHYRTALKKGYERAWYRVAVKAAERGEKDSALSRFKRGAERGDAACLYTLGLANLKGLYRIRKNASEGLRLIEQAVHGSDADFPRAPYVLGKILLGEGGDVPNGLSLEVGQIKQDRARGLQLVQQSAMLGFAPALVRMGQARQSKEFGFDCGIALRYMSLAAEQEAYRRFRRIPTQLKGEPESNIIKWLLCGYKDVIRVNEQWAFRFAEVGAVERNGTALFALGYFYEVGVNTNTDPVKAIEFYRAGAREGCAAASARLDQMATNKPNLRRTLTRQDHDAKMRKHRTALIRGEGDASLAAINDQSTLESGSAKVPSPIPEPQPPQGETGPTDQSLNPALRQARPPYPDSPDRSPQNSASDLSQPQRGPSLSSLSSGPSVHSANSYPSVLPYPVEENHQDHSSQRFSPAGSFHSASERPPLPYPDHYDPKVPLTFGGPLPYPRSPESPRRSPASDERLNEAVQSVSLDASAARKPRPVPSYRSFSSGPETLEVAQPAHAEAAPQTQPQFRRGHGATMSMGNVPTAARLMDTDTRMRSSESLQTVSQRQSRLTPSASRQNSPDYMGGVSVNPPNRVPVASRSSSSADALPSGAYSANAQATSNGANDAVLAERLSDRRSHSAFTTGTIPQAPVNGPAGSLTGSRAPSSINPRGNTVVSSNSAAAPGRVGPHTVQDAAPLSARTSLHSASGEIPDLAPSLPMSGSDPALSRTHGGYTRVESARTSPSPSMQARAASSNNSTPMHTPTSSRPTSPSPSPSWGSADNRSPPGSPGSAGSPGRRRKARPLSSGWVRESFLPGASRFFSASQPQLDKSGYADGPGPESQVRQRSPSPLRKMFKSTQDHRSVTDSAVLQKPKGPDPAVANMPKVPVQPIQVKREPGVAYTFEDMGVTAVTSAKNDKCIIA